jgi:hypothetical protein
MPALRPVTLQQPSFKVSGVATEIRQMQTGIGSFILVVLGWLCPLSVAASITTAASITAAVAATITTAKVMTMPTYLGMMGMIRLFTAAATRAATDIACPSAPRSLLVLNPI